MKKGGRKNAYGEPRRQAEKLVAAAANVSSRSISEVEDLVHDLQDQKTASYVSLSEQEVGS